MSRLETQINQIYYLPDSAKQVSLMLIDEILSNNSHLFVIADLVKIEKKTELNELKRISEIILSTFKNNKKLTGETLFESALAEINTSLGNLAHAGKKSWLGKFSSLIVLKSGNNVFLANTGHMAAILWRTNQFLEILTAEKRGIHPLTIFSNFSTGKLKTDDILILTSANLFNFVALQNLGQLINAENLSDATERISKILQDTANPEEGFASFFVSLTKSELTTTIKESVLPPIVIEPEPIPTKSNPQQTNNLPVEEIYAPLPHQLTSNSIFSAIYVKQVFNKILSVRQFRLKNRVSIKLPKIYQHLSPWGKFFLISFLIFILLLAGNILAHLIQKHQNQNQDQVTAQINKLTANMNDAESALIYRNQDQALQFLDIAQTDLEKLKSIDLAKYEEFKPQIAALANRVNHITVVENPTVLADLKHPMTSLARAGKGFALADQTSGAISTFGISNNDKTGNDLFMLNKIGGIQGIAHIPSVGHVVATSSELYLVNTTQSQFDLIHVFPKTNFTSLKFVAPDKLYAMDKPANQIYKLAYTKSNQSDPEPLLKSSADLSQAVDFALGSEMYVLTPDDLHKFSNGSRNANFAITQPTDQIAAANRVFAAANLYILEAAKKRVLIYNKQGVLLTQIFLPSTSDLKDLYVDEASRNLYLLDANRILSITI